ncbi:HNH endonuclease [Pleionea sp. CnH1-48]|uniref:HNH endonuclease n=1 Tax=Pleionea sp. CnH1-48 TaxID=2954494 RepID=UPI0020968D71|nr:HNH endonuclease [Pleionea sp. CnH1-48]MCO7227550.1 HNH endonuclease [Pleionea sp. CnH1-48]
MGGSKKFRGKTCVYCRSSKSTTADHVFPRELFQIEQRGNLPKVPSCKECNNEKSKLEHYLTAVLPFGATHSDSKKALSVDVSKRLEKNRKLHRKLKDGFGYMLVPSSEGGQEKRLAINLDYEQLHELVGFIGRGLIWHHWNRYLPLDRSFTVFTPSLLGIEFVSDLLQKSSNLRVAVQLGDDTVRYNGVMSEIDEGISVWTILLLGGMTVFDDDLSYEFKNSFVAMITGSEKAVRNIERYISN